MNQNQSHTRKLTAMIDVHSHAIFPDLGAQPPMANPPAWSPEETVAVMDRNGVSACVLSIPYAANHAEGPVARDAARRVNERLADIVQRHPGRFGAVASLPGRDADGCLEEIAYALDTLGLDGVCTTTNINGAYLGDARFDPWFDELNRRQATLFIHPVGSAVSSAVDLGLDVSMLEFMFDTTRMLANMVFSGAKARFADMRMISTHGGGTVPYLAQRLQTLSQAFGSGKMPGRRQLTSEDVRAGLASFYYDVTAATSSAQLHALRELVPAAQLLMGLDHPFMPEWTFQPAIEAIAQWPGLSEAELTQLAHGNARALYPALARRMG